eukprot:8692462-Pyramimonas_sp.AAC.1
MRVKSSTRLPAVTWLTVHRRLQVALRVLGATKFPERSLRAIGSASEALQESPPELFRKPFQSIPGELFESYKRVLERLRHASTRACTRGGVPGSASEARQERSSQFFRKAFQCECLFALQVLGTTKCIFAVRVLDATKFYK